MLGLSDLSNNFIVIVCFSLIADLQEHRDAAAKRHFHLLHSPYFLVCEAFQVEIDYCALVTENAATTVADQFAPCNGYSYVFLCGGAMQSEQPNDFFRRDTAMLFHQLNDP